MSIRYTFLACAAVAIGALTIGNYWTSAPAAAEGNDDSTITLQPVDAAGAELTLVALLDDEPEDGEEREERNSPRDGRESAEGREREQPRREGEQPAREGEPRREADRDRREGDRPREGDARREGDRPREGDARREGDRPREGDARRGREGDPRRETFRAKTDNELALYRMIVQLQREVAELRAALRSRAGDARREGADRDVVRDQPRREGDQPRREGDQPRRESDQPRREGDKPREATDRPRDRDAERPAAPREGEGRESRQS